MVSGIGTSSGFEERIRFSEIDIVDSSAIDTGVMHTLPEGNYINGWDVNVAGVRITSVKQHIRHHRHAEFLLRIKRKGELEHFVARRYGDFTRLHRRLRLELPGRILPPVPKKNKSNSTASGIMSAISGGGNDSDASSVSSTSTRMTGKAEGGKSLLSPLGGEFHPPSRSPSMSCSLFCRRSKEGRFSRINTLQPFQGRHASLISRRPSEFCHAFTDYSQSRCKHIVSSRSRRFRSNDYTERDSLA